MTDVPASIQRPAPGAQGNPAAERREAHPAFLQPDRGDRPVWHYMTLAKFIALLDTRSLYFCRLDCLDDDYEGALPRHWRARRGDAGEVAEEIRRLRAFCYVNCWNMSDSENEALWRLYGVQEASIAIRSTYDELAALVSRSPSLHLGLVRYVDDESAPDGIGSDPLVRVMHKRRAFRHEEEVRFVRLLDGFAHPESDERAGPRGLDLPVDVERLIHGVYIDPYAPQWFEKVVRAVVAKFAPALADRVTWSSMKADPIY
jgi:hypothetical protein